MAYEKKGGNGGAREGAGRPKLEATVLRRVLIEKLEKNAGPIADALIARGLEGDVPALRELLDRGLGKPVQGIDHTTNGKDLPTPILGGITQTNAKDEGTDKSVQ